MTEPLRIRSDLMVIESLLHIALETGNPMACDRVVELLDTFHRKADRLIYTLQKEGAKI
jgi:hypothetical protein